MFSVSVFSIEHQFRNITIYFLHFWKIFRYLHELNSSQLLKVQLVETEINIF